MKRIIMLSVFSFVVSICNGQEWFTSFDVAKRLALVQNKMLFVLWEDSFNNSIPVFIRTEDGQESFFDLSKVTSLDPIIWKYFIPVRLSELNYSDFIKDAKGRGQLYMDKLNDDSIKIMDINGTILNVNDPFGEIVNFDSFINKYAMNTLYLNSELKNYLNNKTLLTSSLLALRYVDYAIFSAEDLRPDIIKLANIYLDESEKFISELNSDKNVALLQRIELTKIKELMILNEYKKAYRKIKRIDENELETVNEPLFVFLNYTVFKMLNDEMNADLWKSKISSLDLKKAELILKNNMNGSSN